MSEAKPDSPVLPVLERGVAVVTFVLGAFGSYLLSAAPPTDADPRFAAGGASFLALLALLLISALATGRKTRKLRSRWMVAAIGLTVLSAVLLVAYPATYRSRTFHYPRPDSEQTHFRGAVLTPEADRHVSSAPGMSVQQLVGDFGGPGQVERVWTAESLRNAWLLLTTMFLLMVVSVASALFCLTEVLLWKPKTAT